MCIPQNCILLTWYTYRFSLYLLYKIQQPMLCYSISMYKETSSVQMNSFAKFTRNPILMGGKSIYIYIYWSKKRMDCGMLLLLLLPSSSVWFSMTKIIINIDSTVVEIFRQTKVNKESHYKRVINWRISQLT